MKDASNVPDLSRMLRDGLPYLTRSEATEVQLALAVSLYAHSNSSSSYSSRSVHGQHDDRVKVSRVGISDDNTKKLVSFVRRVWNERVSFLWLSVSRYAVVWCGLV